MRIVYSDKVKFLFEKIEPYVDWKQFPPKLKTDSPSDIKHAYSEWKELIEKENRKAMEY